MRARGQRRAMPAGVWALLLALAACATYQPFDSESYLEERYLDRVPAELRASVEVPYRLDETTLAAVRERLSPAGGEKRRSEEIVDFIFSGLDLTYSLTPTRNASDTYASRSGNCLSFVNLFVGIARAQRLNPFYVEVRDYQRWNYREGVVVSRGHIVAGMRIDGELSTFDFLPYRPKAYRDFRPIDDLAAMAHFYNNLGAEALMADDLERAGRMLHIANALAPDFEKAINNLGVFHMRSGAAAAAAELYARGLELFPDSVPLLSNLARAKQELGAPAESTELLSRIEGLNQTNPFFFVYRGEVALAGGDTQRALDYMRKALRIDSEVPEVHVGLVKVFLDLGDLKRARHHLSRALKLDATHDEARKFAALLDAEEAGPERPRQQDR